MVVSVGMSDEDEDVVVQGSTLHKYLSKLGYLDFDTVPTKHTHIERQTFPKFADIVLITKHLYKKLCSVYSWIVQEDAVSQSRLSKILKAHVLLDDHALMILDFIQDCPIRSWNYKVPSSIILFSSAFALYILLNHKNVLGFICMSSVAYSITSETWLQYCADNNLKCVVSLQNDLYYLCKKGLKILRSDYKFKPGIGQSSEQFHELMNDRLCYLQPLAECLINYMENISLLSYKISLIILELLPKSFSIGHLLTKFHYNSFALHGRINYQSLKRLYNTHILVQSEMLQLIAIAYNTNTWSESYNKIPEIKLNYISQLLIKHLMAYKDKLKQIIDDYYSSDIKLIRFEYKGTSGSKWQELYIQLDITAHKVQLAYSNLLSIIKDIDTVNSETSTDDDRIEVMMKKMNEAYKDLETAKNFAEFSSLLIAKARNVNCKKDNIIRNTEDADVSSELPVVIDVEPKIVDEVFEEYIKEEYLKPLFDEDDELAVSSYKLDKLLAKNFMSELKEALIDKHKSMSERESKALQRMYKNIVKDSQIESEINTNPSIPTPPPMPPWNICLPKDSFCVQKRRKFPAFESHERDLNADCGQQPSTFNEFRVDNTEKTETLLSLSSESLSSPFTFNFPTPFMKVAEEVFVGSGENSEDEFTDVQNDIDENTE